MTDLAKQISLLTSKLSEQLESLENEVNRWTDFKNDYDALEVQLKTLPEQTKKKAMIPIGKLAFMPGTIIHTNEILVLLGDQYYAERSAKQAIEIVGRRREVVVENLRLAEAQLNSMKAKSSSLNPGNNILSGDGTQYNEEGLPIMDIREELPPLEEEERKKPVDKGKAKQIAPGELPESVLRARKMMQEADEKIKQKSQDENKALFDMLRQLEEEEEEEEGVVIDKTPIYKKDKEERLKHKDEDEEEDFDDFSDDEEDERYDRDVSENMFDRFADDEEYAEDGIVDQEDFTVNEEDEEEEEETVLDVVKESAPVAAKVVEKPLSEVKERVPVSEVKERTPVSSKVFERAVSEVKERAPVSSKVFERAVSEVKERAPVSSKVFERAVSEVKERAPVSNQVKERTVSEVKERTALPSQVKEKTVSKTKETAIQKSLKKKKSVSFNHEADVRDHDFAAAPNMVGQTESYSQPTKTDKKPDNNIIRSPADIFRTIKATQKGMEEDGYPDLDQTESAELNLNELINVARTTPESFFRSKDGSEALIPMVKDDDEDDEEEDESSGILVTSKSKLDNKIMKGAVMERETAPIDLEKVEEDMDLREITSSYQQKRQSMLAAAGEFSFAPKPEFEVFEEELPLPKNKIEPEEEEEPVAKPKKMSRFKAARLGLKVDDEY